MLLRSRWAPTPSTAGGAPKHDGRWRSSTGSVPTNEPGDKENEALSGHGSPRARLDVARWSLADWQELEKSQSASSCMSALAAVGPSPGQVPAERSTH